MADVKVSGLPSDSSLDGNHYVPVNDPTGPTTKRTLLSTLAAFFFNQVNIPAGSGSPVTRADEVFNDFVYSGMLWSADSIGSTRNGSMTSGTIYINGRRLSISSVTARSFTASKDTYIDLLDNLDGTGTLVYTEVANAAAQPSIAANSLRIASIVTNGSAITLVIGRAPRNADEIARAKIIATSSAPAGLIISNIPAYDYLNVTAHVIQSGGALNSELQFNGDTASNYNETYFSQTAAGGAVTGGGAGAATGWINLEVGSGGVEETFLMDIINLSSKEKKVNLRTLDNSAAGAGNIMRSMFNTAKWANTSAQINSINIFTSTNAYAALSEIILKGRN